MYNEYGDNMNKKGFTLVELIASIGIMIVLALIVVPNVMKTIEKNRTKLYKNQETRLEEAAAKYLSEIYISNDQTSITINKSDLIEAGYIGEIYDIKNKNSICEAYVNVTNLDTTPVLESYLNCPNYETP